MDQGKEERSYEDLCHTGGKKKISDRAARAAADPGACGAVHHFHAHHVFLQHGGHLFCGTHQHLGNGCGGRRAAADEHHSGAWLYLWPWLGQLHLPRPWQGRGRRGKKDGHRGLCFRHHRGHAVFYDLSCVSGRNRGSAGRYAHHCAPCKGLYEVYSDRCSLYGLLAGAQQPAALSGQCVLRHDRHGHGRGAQHCAGPAVHFCV